MLLLIFQTVKRPGDRLQPGRLDFPAAIDTNSVCAFGYSLQSIFHLAQHLGCQGILFECRGFALCRRRFVNRVFHAFGRLARFSTETRHFVS